MVVNYAIPDAVDNCDPKITATCIPPSGSVFAVGTTTVTCMAVDDSNNTNSCSFQVKVNPPPPPVIAHGLIYRPMGHAQLAVDANGELLISNAGASGQDGFRVELGAAEGWEAELVSDPFGPGQQLHHARVQHAFGGLLFEDRLSFSQQGLFASVDFSPAGVVTSLVEVVGQTLSSAQKAGNNQWIALQPVDPPGANSPQLSRRTIRSQRTSWTLAWPSQVTYAFDYSDAEPDFFGLDPNLAEDEEDDLSIAVPISAADFFYQNTPPFRIRRASLGMFGQEHFALGQAMFHAQWPTLSLSNIGPSGLDGVLIPLPQVPAFAAELLAENLANTPAGAVLRFEACGALGTANQPSYRGSLGNIQFLFTGQQLEFSADFSVFGTSGAIIEIYDQAALVVTFSLDPNQSGFVWPSWPTRVGISPRETAEPTAPPVYEVSVGSRQQLILPNGSAVMGDRVTARPTGGLDRLSALDQVSLRVASRSLTIVHETTDWQDWTTPVPSLYTLWSAGQWLPNAPESTKPDADPDGDSISNFAEYGLGLDPLTPSRIGLPQLTFVPDGSNVFGALRLRVPIWAKDVRYHVWASDGLQEPIQWVPLDGIFDEEPISGLHKEIIIRDLIPDKHQRFLKVDLEQVEPAGGFVTDAPVLPTSGDSLRIGFYNVQFLAMFDRFDCCDDMPNRARRIAERIRATGFDVIALCEAFKGDAKDRLVEELSPTFPHYVRLLRESLTAPQDSGLMLFSRHPFVPLPPAAAAFTPGVLRAFSAGMPWTSVAFTRFDECHGLTGHGSDCLAEKGAGLVRIQNANSGRIYNVVFTHLDASSGDSDAAARSSQLSQIADMLGSIFGAALDSEDVFLMGDLNIKGQISGDRSEWTTHFGTAGSFFTDVLHDAWEEQTNLPELGFEFRDQGLTSKVHAPGGSINRKDYLLVNRPSSLPPGRLPLRVQYMAIAFGLRDSVPTAFGPTGRFEAAAFGFAGRQDLSDHYGIIADLNLDAPDAPFCTPQTSSNNPPLVVGGGPNVATVLRGTIVHAGGMHWYRFDQSGTYSIAMRSGNFTHHVYDSRQLSLPVPNYRDETRVLVDSTGAEVTARVFDVPEGPLYIRVSHIHRTGSGNYELIIRRHEGNSAEDAIVLTPNNNTRPYRADFTASSGSLCRWFRVNTEQAHSGRRQNLQFYVRSLTPGTVYRLSIVDSAVPRWSDCPPAPVLEENFGEERTETVLPGFLGGNQLFMVVQPSAATVSFEAGWSTDLTVIHPYVPGYCPGSATATSLTCREETDGAAGPGDDRNVRFDVAILDSASGDVLHARGPFPLLENWDKGRNHNIEAELGTLRFLTNEQVRVRLIVRDRPRDDDRLDGVIPSLGRDVHRGCNSNLDARGHGGRYQLNFHMSHGVPAIP
jgi:endonuclease/exonuclease/phosphatase family metal-dependent hydrolase